MPVNETAIQEHLPGDWRNSKWLAVAELAVVVLIFIADIRGHIPFSKTPFLLAFASISLWVRRIGWRRVGLQRYKSWKQTLLIGVTAGLLLEAFELFISQPLLTRWLHRPPDLEVFNDVHGNIKLTLIYLALTWTLGAFGEEMVYRGYLMNRVADLMKGARYVWVISLIVVHLGFGIAHVYQGLTGALDEGLMGLLLGIMYLRTGRNLAVPIVAHGVQDSVDFILMFLGKYPGM
jgi:uncharacterized protein